MLGTRKRYEIGILLKTGHPKTEVARLARGLRDRSFASRKRIPVLDVNDSVERTQPANWKTQYRRGFPEIGPPERKSGSFLLTGNSPASRESGGGLSRWQDGPIQTGRFLASHAGEACGPFRRIAPGEFSQHDFGHYNVKFVDGTFRRVLPRSRDM